MNSIKCNNVLSNKIKPLHVSANDGHHRQETSNSYRPKYINKLYFVIGKQFLHFSKLTLYFKEVSHILGYLLNLFGEVGISQSVKRRDTGWKAQVRFPAVQDFFSLLQNV
jgi:hypothetical protein